MTPTFVIRATSAFEHRLKKLGIWAEINRDLRSRRIGVNMYTRVSCG